MSAAETGRLAFPGKIRPYSCGQSSYQRWIVADSGHHQIVAIGDDGREINRFGSGEAGFRDGPAKSACFNSPQAIACSCDALYVADTGNHAIRKLDLIDDTVTTLVGLGTSDDGFGVPGDALPVAPLPGRTVALSGVCDLELAGGRLYFANPGSQQLGVFQLATGLVLALAGDGVEGRVDGPAHAARLANPGALALATGRLFFIDRATDSLRLLHLAGEPRIQTLFHEGQPIRLQNPCALAYVQEQLFIAEQGQSGLRLVDLQRQVVEDWGTDWAPPLHDARGLVAVNKNRALVVEGNRIFEYDLKLRRCIVMFE